MPKVLSLAVAALALVGTSHVAEAKRLNPEQRLAKLLEGRVAGEAQDCIYLPSVRSTWIIPRTAIVYDAGGVLWVNRPETGASLLDDDDVLVTKTHDTRLCSIDVVRLHDRNQQVNVGFVALDKFVPYRRPARGN